MDQGVFLGSAEEIQMVAVTYGAARVAVGATPRDSVPRSFDWISMVQLGANGIVRAKSLARPVRISETAVGAPRRGSAPTTPWIVRSATRLRAVRTP